MPEVAALAPPQRDRGGEVVEPDLVQGHEHVDGRVAAHR